MQQALSRSNIIKYTLLILYVLLIALPLFVVIIPTFQTVQESSKGIFTRPTQLNLSNYIEAWNQSNFPLAFRNSVIITGSTIVITGFLGALAAFPIGIRYRVRLFRNVFFTFLAGLMLPFQSIMIPMYILMGRTLRLTNTFIGIIMVYVAMTLPLTVFLYSQFIADISREMEEAAVVDGCGYFKMFWAIYFPLLKPVTAAIVIQNMLFLWNDLLVPLILIDKAPTKPIMPMVYVFFGSYYNQWNLAFSVLLLAALPFVILFLLLQKQFIAGMSMGAVKG